ncbi:MAG: lipopolysaccharide biosynthesis protein [Bacteroidota bacterium]|jgi:lipopolysaccharide exporter
MFGRISRQQELVKSILTLFTGSAIAQAIPLLVSPFLTRLYSVDDFATLTIVATLISLVGVVVTGRYEFAVGLPSKDADGRKMVQLALLFTIVISLLVSSVLLFGRDVIASWIGFPADPDYLFAVPLAALFYGGYQSYSFWQIRCRNYVVISGSRIGQSLTNSGLSLGLFYSGLGINGLVIGNVMGHFSAFLYSFMATRDRLKGFWNNKFSELKELGSKYGDMPRVNSIHALSDVGQTTAVVLLITSFFGSVSTGLYGLTIRILQAPLNMMGNSLSMVFYKEVAEKTANNHQISKLLLSTVKTLLLISIPVFLVILIMGPDLFSFVFGANWRDAGVFAQILSPWLFLNFIASPLSNLPIILNRQRAFFIYSLVGNLTVILSLVISGWLLDDIKQVLTALAITQSVFQIIMIAFFFKIAKVADESKIN